MNISKNGFSSIEQMSNQFLSTKKNNAVKKINSTGTFEEILKTKQEPKVTTEKLKFSKHANQRLASRNIDLSTEQLERLENGTNKAREKGIKESLVMVDNLAFIVNIKNNTVVTTVAVEQNQMEGTIFTNIDGAVIG